MFGAEELEEETYNTGGLTYEDMVANMDEEKEVSLEEAYEKELEEQEATPQEAVPQEVPAPMVLEVSEEEPVEEVEEELQVVDNETPSEIREAYMQEMEDNYSNFMDQLQMDAES